MDEQVRILFFAASERKESNWGRGRNDGWGKKGEKTLLFPFQKHLASKNMSGFSTLFFDELLWEREMLKVFARESGGENIQRSRLPYRIGADGCQESESKALSPGVYRRQHTWRA